ncbi:hypothetical protein KIW84_030754 [Lathyrus oleraceus]|uniref:Uncharacterized protein n=1 Tax=Pisum sativum TaxID=3888 RepID=A0A9D4XQ64_PEA|nr:hypothetical protein KIW84_030754 [Pisum sativum]
MKHDNGRIYVLWKDNNIRIKMIKSTGQMIYCGIFELSGDLRYLMATIYPLNRLDQRKKLGKDIEELRCHQTGPWFLMGDFNNVLKSQDIIGGNLVTNKEYIDLRRMMENFGLYDMDSSGDYYTWSNKQSDCAIYSRIDRVLGTWSGCRTIVTIISLLCIIVYLIKFINSTADLEGFLNVVESNWKIPIHGRPMMNIDKIDLVKKHTEDFTNWQEMEEKVLNQKAKLDWMKLGDGKYKHEMKSINTPQKDDDTLLTAKDDIHKEVMYFYTDLMGKSDNM